MAEFAWFAELTSFSGFWFPLKLLLNTLFSQSCCMNVRITNTFLNPFITRRVISIRWGKRTVSVEYNKLLNAHLKLCSANRNSHLSAPVGYCMTAGGDSQQYRLRPLASEYPSLFFLSFVGVSIDMYYRVVNFVNTCS